MSAPIPFTVTIDTEEEWDWNGPFPVRDFAVTNILKLSPFQELCDKYGVRPTYFVNHAVLDRDESRDKIVDIGKSESVEIGMHLHPWNTPPIKSESVAEGESFTHQLPADVQLAKLQTTFDAHRAAGLKPTSFRGGRYSSGGVVQTFLVENGFRVDSSICPYTSWPDSGAPDYRDSGLLPNRKEFPNNQVLWEIPLTMAATRLPYARWLKTFHAIENSAWSKMKLIGLSQKLGIASRVWLNFECEDFPLMQKFLQSKLDPELTHLTFTIHSSSLSIGPGPYCRSAEDHQRIFDGIESVFQILKDRDRFYPVTMTQLAEEFEEKL